MQPAETAVAHDEHMVARRAARASSSSSSASIDPTLRAFAPSGRATCAGVPAEVRRREQPHRIGAGERGRQRVPMHAHASSCSSAARAPRRGAPLPIATAQPVDGGGDGGGVMREIVVDADAGRVAAQLHASAHALERGQRGDALRHGHAGMARGGDAPPARCRHCARRASTTAPRPCGTPSCSTSNREQSAPRRRAPTSARRRRSLRRNLRAASSSPSRAPASRFASRGVGTMRPLPGTMRSR